MPGTPPKYNLKEAFEIHNQGGGAGRITLEEFARLVPKSDWGMTYLEMAEKYGWERSDKLKKAEAEGKIKLLKNGGSLAPIIPTYYKSKGTPIYRDTTDAPPRIFENGGGKDKIKKINNMGALSDKYLNKIIEQKLFDGPGDIPDTLEGLNSNDYTAVVYNAVKEIITSLRESGELKADQNLDAAGITAQILLETGNGKSSLASKYNNFGGIKAGQYWKGETIMIPNSDGDVQWRVYPSVKKGLEEQVRFFLPSKNPRYFEAGVLSSKNAAEHARRVQEAGYAGDQKDYADRVIEMANSIQNRLKKANPDYVKGATYTGVSMDNNIPTSTSYQESTGQDFIQQDFQPITIGERNPAAVFLNDNTKVDLLDVFTAPLEIFNPSTKILDNSFYNDNRDKEELKQSVKNQNFIDSPIKYKKGGKMKFNKIYPSKYKNYPRYYNDGGLLDGVDPENPINYQIDAATGNLRIYDPNTNSFNVTNVPYKGDNTVMMSHMGERFLGTDNNSTEAVYGRLKMAQDFYNMENQRSQVAQKQLAERTDMLIDKKGKAFLPSTTYDFLTSNGGKSGCMAGSSGCFEPTEEQLQDPSYKSELTVPYFLKSKDDRYVKQILPFRNTSPEGFAQTYKNTEFRPNIFPTARVKNPNFGKVNSSGNVDNREYITRTTSKGNTRSEGSTQTPGGVLPTITGSATYIAQYPKLGLDEIAVGEPIEAGDRVTSGGRKGVYYDYDLERYVTSDEIKRTGKNNDHHNYGIGTEKDSGYSDFDEEGNPIQVKKYNVGAIGGNLLYQPNFEKQPYGPDSAGNQSGSGDLVTRYKGDTPYYNSIRQDLFKYYGFDEFSASDYIKNYEQSQAVLLNKLPGIKPGLLEQKSSGNIIRGKEYPNTRKGRKQKERSDAYIKWYMSQMQKK